METTVLLNSFSCAVELEKENSRALKARPTTQVENEDGEEREETHKKNIWADIKSAPTRPIFVDQVPFF